MYKYIVRLLKNNLLVEFVVDCEGSNSQCDDSNGEFTPFCEYTDDTGYHREECTGNCLIQDIYNVHNNVSYCCEFNQGQLILPSESHCCGYIDACHDNWEQTNDCSRDV